MKKPLLVFFSRAAYGSRALPSRHMLFTAITGVAALGVFNTRTTSTGCRRQQSGIDFQSDISVEPIRNTHRSFGKCGLDLGVTALRRCPEAGPARNPRSSEQKTAPGERPLSGARILPGEGRDERIAVVHHRFSSGGHAPRAMRLTGRTTRRPGYRKPA